MLYPLLLVLLSTSSAVASVTARTHVEIHKGVPSNWVQEPVEASTLVRITVAVKQQNTELFEKELLQRSDPTNLDYYGKWLNKDMVDSILQPKQEAVANVKAWLQTASTTPIESSSTGDFLSTVVTVHNAEKFLFDNSAHYQRYVSGALSILRLNTTYTVPMGIAQHIDFLGPSIRFPVVQITKAGIKKRQLFGPSGNGITPTVLRKMYNATSAVAAAGTKNIQAVASFLGQFYSPSDLSKFFTKYSSESKIRKPTVHGPNQASQPGIEAELDIQYVMGVGRDIPTQFWSTPGTQPGNPANEPFLVWLEAVGNMTDATMPLTISISYGDNEPGVDMSYALRVNTEFQKAGIRGTSIMFSSGDGGVAGGQTAPCTLFVPTFPASSPFVTAVGGTTKSDPEVCASFSSGGFSNYFKRPAYQDAAVKGYFASGTSGIPSASLYNSTGAGIPDVSAQGENFDVIVNGFTNPVDGTSCSSPAFTGIVGLLNEARLSAGKSSLGYLNQLIYKTAGPAGAFNDVTEGSNPGCNTQGFPAAKGWDPVTGWGTPNYGKLKDIVMALP